MSEQVNYAEAMDILDTFTEEEQEHLCYVTLTPADVERIKEGLSLLYTERKIDFERARWKQAKTFIEQELDGINALSKRMIDFLEPADKEKE